MVTKTNFPPPIEVEAETQYSWFSCSFNQIMPMCDHSHRELSDKISIKFVSEETKTLYLCECSETQTPPYCDDSNDCKEI